MSYPSYDLTFNQYQELAKETALYPQVGQGDINLYPYLGLSGECGEVLEKVKKIYRDKNGVLSEEDKKELIKELGDVIWYLSAISSNLEIEFQEIALLNLYKLAARNQNNTLQGNGDNR